MKSVEELGNDELIAEFVRLAKAARMTQSGAADAVGVAQPTASEWWRKVYRELRPENRLALEKFVREKRGEGAQDPAAAPDEWQTFALETVRYAGGQGQWSEEQQRLIKLDVLEGMIRLGTAQGRDVGVLQDLQRELQAAAGLPAGWRGARETSSTPRGVDVLAFYDRESRAAELRAEGMREWAVAVRMAEEETRARRAGVEVSARDLAVARQGVAAVRLVREQERLAQEHPRARGEARGPAEEAPAAPPPDEK